MAINGFGNNFNYNYNLYTNKTNLNSPDKAASQHNRVIGDQVDGKTNGDLFEKKVYKTDTEGNTGSDDGYKIKQNSWSGFWDAFWDGYGKQNDVSKDYQAYSCYVPSQAHNAASLGILISNTIAGFKAGIDYLFEESR